MNPLLQAEQVTGRLQPQVASEQLEQPMGQGLQALLHQKPKKHPGSWVDDDKAIEVQLCLE